MTVEEPLIEIKEESSSNLHSSDKESLPGSEELDRGQVPAKQKMSFKKSARFALSAAAFKPTVGHNHHECSSDNSSDAHKEI